MNKVHYSNISDFNEALGLRPPEHPLFDVVRSSEVVGNPGASRSAAITTSNDFYTISMKHFLSGEFHYGRTKYDCSCGTMIFTAPRQELRAGGLKVDSTGIMIIIHEDFVRGHRIKDRFKNYSFFNYAVHEALHLSPKEERHLRSLFESILIESHNSFDAFTKELILSHIDVILRYSDRYYHRQFLMRKESDNSMLSKFETQLEKFIDEEEGIPSVEQIAGSIYVTSRYLSDALKAETGKTAKELILIKIIDLSKDLLLSSKDSVATIAYSLGFESPNYFARLFKKKVGQTPSQYRSSLH